MSANPEAYDLVIVGGGPAGLSAAIAGQSERTNTVVLDSLEHGPQLGGQAATTSCIKNYPGFPEGLSGDDLMARFVKQAYEFGATLEAPLRAERIEQADDKIAVITDNSETFYGTAVLIATGVKFRRLRIRNMAAYLGRGAYYGPPNHNTTHENKTTVVIGGGNSAGQAAVNLSESNDCEVHLLIRGSSIDAKMSGYLVDEVVRRPNIVIHTDTELVDVDGDGRLEKATIQTKGKDGQAPQQATLDVNEIFTMVGMEPKTLWVPENIAKDDQGFIKGGADLSPEEQQRFLDETHGRQQFGHETTMPQVFIAGDGRCGTNKRVSTSQADGTNMLSEFHRLRDAIASGK